jgi:hypothetical protein
LWTLRWETQRTTNFAPKLVGDVEVGIKDFRDSIICLDLSASCWRDGGDVAAMLVLWSVVSPGRSIVVFTRLAVIKIDVTTGVRC